MRTLEQCEAKLEKYGAAESLFFPGIGNISWHFSTGDNIEVLYLEAQIGHGVTMYCRMVKTILANGRLPYHSVFAYRLASNEIAGKFYAKLGWQQEDLGQSIYKGDGTVLMWITWEDLLKSLERFMHFDKDWSE
jgi:hypothetical protein